MSCSLHGARVHCVWYNSLSPEGRVDADVVGLREGRCSPPAGGGRRREILLILGLHLCCNLSISYCCWPYLIIVALVLVLPRFPAAAAAVSSSCFSRGCWMRTLRLLLCAVSEMVSWKVIINFVERFIFIKYPMKYIISQSEGGRVNVVTVRWVTTGELVKNLN